MDQIEHNKLMEMSADARAFLNSPAFDHIFEQMKAQNMQELIQADVGSLTAASAHASMKVLENFKSRLQSLANEETFIQQRRKLVNGRPR